MTIVRRQLRAKVARLPLLAVLVGLRVDHGYTEGPYNGRLRLSSHSLAKLRLKHHLDLAHAMVLLPQLRLVHFTQPFELVEVEVRAHGG